MRKLTLVTIAALLAAGMAAPVVAQDATVELSPDQQTTIIQDFSGDDVVPAPSVGFDVVTGAVVPDTVELHPLPEKIIKVVPGYSSYEYFRTSDGRIVIVSPEKKVINVLQ